MPESTPAVAEVTPVTEVAGSGRSAAEPPAPPWIRRWVADPGRVFLLVGATVGIVLAFLVPQFGGIDEPAHFYRSYQISTGRLLPLDTHQSDFSGACVPPDVVRGVLADRNSVLEHNLRLAGLPSSAARPTKLADVPRCPSDPTQRFVTFSTFGSPVPYAPQAAAIFVARTVGAGVDGMVLAARLATLAVYLALVWLAIRRAPMSRWALCAVGLLPVALFQASVSESHDAVTIALSLLVVSSALRLVAADDHAPLGPALAEALVLTLLLAACKPGYIVIAACYWLPLLGSAGRRRRARWWPLALVPAVGVVGSVLWNEAVGGLWKTDAGLFGVAVDPARQRHLLLHEPWTFVAAAVRTSGQDLWDWGKGLITLGPSVAVWPTVGVLAALVVLALIAVQRSAHEPAGLDRAQRVLVLLVFGAGCLLVLGAQYVYWTAPGADVVGGMQARFFVPLLVLVPIAVGPRRGRWARADAATVPLPVLLVPVYVALLVTIAFRMH
jgi:uncharacterized membrane protein